MLELCGFSFTAMGSPCEIRLYGLSRHALEPIAQTAISEVRRIEAKYSRYRDDSVISQINQNAGQKPVAIDAETAALLDYAQVCFEQSDGLFDITSGILRRVWDFKSGQLPRQKQINQLLPLIGWQQVQRDAQQVFLPKAGMQLDLGGFVKEHTADLIALFCQQQGVAHGLVNLGGDLAIIGPHPDGSPWHVGIRHPRNVEQAMAKIPVHAGGLASSGDYERYMCVKGRYYGHILNPKTGWPVSGLASVSVLAPRCLIAGSATTIAMLQGMDGLAWLDQLGLAYLAMDLKGRVYGSIQGVQT